jgi:tetratricopeptide (TPR) repeat protein
MPVASDLVKNHWRTTDPTIALTNLDSQISESTRMFAERPNDTDLRGKSISLLLQRSGVTGSAADRKQALDIAEADAKERAGDPDAHKNLAHALAAMHRFDEALVELDAADKLSKIPGTTTQLRLGVLAGLGRYDEVYPTHKELAEKFPSPSSLLDLATTAAKMGKTEEAEQAFVQAEEKYHGAAPFLLASIYFERASMWERLGDLSKATVLYKAALERLPQHVHSAVHLAALVSPSEGVALLEPLAKGDDADPDAIAQLGVLQNLIKEKSGDESLSRARARYDVLMAEQPAAYADHAGWFWLVAGGDPKKADEAAKKNLAVRKTAEAYELSLATAQASGATRDAVCALADEARALKYRNAKLDEALRPLTDCPPAKKAAP